MLVDTNAIRALGTDCSARADDLSTAAATLSDWPGPDAAAALGAVGDRFLATLIDAVIVEARAIAALSDDLSTAHSVSGVVAGEYADADDAAAVCCSYAERADRSVVGADPGGGGAGRARLDGRG